MYNGFLSIHRHTILYYLKFFSIYIAIARLHHHGCHGYSGTCLLVAADSTVIQSMHTLWHIGQVQIASKNDTVFRVNARCHLGIIKVVVKPVLQLLHITKYQFQYIGSVDGRRSIVCEQTDMQSVSAHGELIVVAQVKAHRCKLVLACCC